jgi:hypothetical protein
VNNVLSVDELGMLNQNTELEAIER